MKLNLLRNFSHQIDHGTFEIHGAKAVNLFALKREYELGKLCNALSDRQGMIYTIKPEHLSQTCDQETG